MVRHQAPPEVRFPHREGGGVTADSPDEGGSTLSGLTIGALTLNPAFDPDVTEYTVTTSNAQNTVRATADDASAAITVMHGTDEVTNGTAVTWDDGENTLTITVTNGGSSTTYTVTVTKSDV